MGTVACEAPHHSPAHPHTFAPARAPPVLGAALPLPPQAPAANPAQPQAARLLWALGPQGGRGLGCCPHSARQPSPCACFPLLGWTWAWPRPTQREAAPHLVRAARCWGGHGQGRDPHSAKQPLTLCVLPAAASRSSRSLRCPSIWRGLWGVEVEAQCVGVGVHGGERGVRWRRGDGKTDTGRLGGGGCMSMVLHALQWRQ